MTTKNILLTTTLSLVAILSVATIPTFEAFAEEEKTGYKFAEDVKTVMTFTFRDGVEVHEFPVYSMTADFVSNVGTTFEVQGVIGDAPYLHKALDESYKYRLMLEAGKNFEFNYRYFDIDVDFVKEGNTFSSLGYYNCEVLNYTAETKSSGDYESYMSSKSGFAIIDNIEFRCGGLNSNNPTDMRMYEGTFTDYATEPLDYKFAEDVRTIVTYDFENGQERIEYHGFFIDSGFSETDSAGPSFSVERVVDYFPILGSEIDKARKLSGVHSSYNSDFDVKVEFVNSEKTLRELDYTDCRVTGAEIVTKSDKEESYTGKTGFALVQETNFSCAGLETMNEGYDVLRGETPIWSTSSMTNTQPTHQYHTGLGATAIATFTYDDGIEVLSFPIFEQKNVLDKSYPSFSLKGIVGDYPMLYKKVDENLAIQNVQNSNNIERFSVDVELMYGYEVARGYNYSGCRIVDYNVESGMNKEETYLKGKFALENTFDFECSRYTPNNPIYDAMFDVVQRAQTVNTNDLRETHSWGPGFHIQ